MSVLLQIIQSKLSFEENYKYIIIFWNTGIILKKMEFLNLKSTRSNIIIFSL
jgi:hypothetical protein